MRKIILSTALAVFAITSVSAQNLDKILDDHFKASAQEKLLKITSITMKGKVVAMGMEKISFVWYLKNISLLAIAGYFAGIGVFLLLV